MTTKTEQEHFITLIENLKQAEGAMRALALLRMDERWLTLEELLYQARMKCTVLATAKSSTVVPGVAPKLRVIR